MVLHPTGPRFHAGRVVEERGGITPLSRLAFPQTDRRVDERFGHLGSRVKDGETPGTLVVFVVVLYWNLRMLDEKGERDEENILKGLDE